MVQREEAVDHDIQALQACEDRAARQGRLNLGALVIGHLAHVSKALQGTGRHPKARRKHFQSDSVAST